MIVNLCYFAPPRTNIGDRFTHPIDYFSWGFETRKYPLDSPRGSYLRGSPSMIVIGGGGLVRHPGRNDWVALSRIVAEVPHSTPVVIWGMGINDQRRLDISYDEALGFIESRHDIFIGLRDHFYHNYVPCVSCMRPEFDEDYKIEREIGVYSHQSFGLSLNYPQMDNTFNGNPEEQLREKISFLGSSEYVITNSYHGAYWATLLGRRVLVVSPFSNKFIGLKFQPVIVSEERYIERHLSYLKTLCRPFPNALSDSRALTRAFASTVAARLSRG